MVRHDPCSSRKLPSPNSPLTEEPYLKSVGHKTKTDIRVERLVSKRGLVEVKGGVRDGNGEEYDQMHYVQMKLSTNKHKFEYLGVCFFFFFFLSFVFFFFSFAWEFCLHACQCTTCMPGTHRGQREGIRCPRTGVTDSCEPCEHWKSNQGPLEDQPANALNH